MRLRYALAAVLLAAAIACEEDRTSVRSSDAPAPVEVGPVTVGPIALVRTFSGTLEAPARFVVASNVAGRVRRLRVDLGDDVNRGDVVVEIDDDELRQLASQAEAELQVARANVTRAETDLDTARRELARIETLRERGVSSEAQLEEARATSQNRAAALEVARAQAARAAAALEAARTRLGYARVTAEWSGGNETRVVAGRFISAGARVSEDTPLIAVVELDPITAVIFVTEREYALLEVGQPASVETDAFPEESFPATVRRVSPVFESASRQARVELRLENQDRRLKPGMFVRATITLKTADHATIVPFSSVTTRDGETGVFVVRADGARVDWTPVRLGVRQGERVQVVGEGIRGRVVTVGQQLVDDDSAITIPGELHTKTPAPEPSAPDAGGESDAR